MNLETQKNEFCKAIEKMEQIMFQKGNDYAGEDRLANFKKAGAVSGLNAELNCLSMIATKVARLGVLLNSDNEPENESIEDSLLDLANYALLLRMIRTEQKNEEVSSQPVPYNYFDRGLLRTGPTEPFEVPHDRQDS
jgi:hypothetical protein